MFDTKARQKLVLYVLGGSAALGSMMGLFQAAPQPIDPEGQTIDRVMFEGLVTIDPIYAQSIAAIHPGMPWNREEITLACRRLAETQKFEGDPVAVERREDGQLVLVFMVNERPVIAEIEFDGNQEFSASDLLGEIDIGIGSPISEFTVAQAARQIEEKYREAGHGYVSVEVDEAALKEERRLVFRISEGPRVRLRKIAFEGNTAFSDLRLKALIESATYIWLFRTGAYDVETADRDAAAIKAFYIARGYLNAQVGHRVDPYKERESDLTLTFVVNEGLLHYIKSVETAGNTVFDEAHIASKMKSKAGAVIDSDVLREDRERILSEYGGLGYIYAEVTLTHVFDEEDGFVHLSVQISEGEQFRVGRIAIRGNRETQDRVIRRELRFFPEKLYDTNAVKQAEQRLLETRLFKEAVITPVAPEDGTPGVREALVRVEEDETTQILFGIGVTTNNGVVGSISIEQRNFDILDWPRSSTELFKGRAFKGAGQTLRLQFEPGTEFMRGRIEFREPYLFDRDVGFGMALYAFERDRDEYDEQRFGFTPSLDKRWREGILKGWAGEVALRIERIDISDLESFTAEEIREDKGDSWLTSAKGTLVRDRTDSRWLPSEGDRFSVAYEQTGVLGGDYDFGKLTGSYDRHWTLQTDRFGRKHILHMGANMGQIFGDAPVFEKFYAGGIGSIRGFEYRGISPRAGIRNDRVGGDFMLLTGAEYSFPLAGKTVRGVTFLDMGTVEEDFGLSDWRASVGAGVRIYIKYFGPIPLAFDLAAPIAKDGDDDTQVFSFMFGTTF